MALNLTTQAPFWKGTRFRVKDAKTSIEFYQKHFAMKYIHAVKNDDKQTEIHYLASTNDDVEFGSENAKKYIRQPNYTLLELLEEQGIEKGDDFSYHNGNTEPRGFGHIAFFCDDLENNCVALEEAGVAFVFFF